MSKIKINKIELVVNKKEMTLSIKENENRFDIEKLQSLSTKSEMIRYLDSCSISRMEIHKTLNILYQHVRNVLITPLSNNKKDA